MIRLNKISLISFFLFFTGCSFLFSRELLSKEWRYHYPVAGVAQSIKVAPLLGDPERIDFLLRDEAMTIGDSVRMSISPSIENTKMDVYILDDWKIYKSVPVTLSWDEASSAGPDRIFKNTKTFVDWNLVLPVCHKESFQRLNFMLHIIRSRIKRINYKENLAIDTDGNFVRIDSGKREKGEGLGSCGFVKWIVDGLYLTRMGNGIPLTFLKQKPYQLRGGRHILILDDQEDPFFTLDWTRNLALAIDLIYNDQAEYGDSDVDYLSEFKYYPHSGYDISELNRVLYMLAVRHPGDFYLGSVNQTFRDKLNLRRHYEAVFFFPRIDLKGRLEVVIFQDGKEFTLEEFVNKYTDDRIHLVDFESDVLFNPNHFESLPVLKR